MALGSRLEQRQSHALVMTPQLQQAIKLLQLSNLELAEYVEQELERNVLLENEAAEPAQAGESEPTEPQTPLETDNLLGSGALAEGEGGIDTEYDNMWGEDSAADAAPEAVLAPLSSGTSSGANLPEGSDAGERTPARPQTLREYLLAQFGTECFEAVDRMIGAYIIEHLDEAGYLREPLADIAGRLGADLDRVEPVLARVQQLEPTGVAARSLGECLALQLAERDRLDPAMRRLIENLDLLAARDYPGLMRLCGVDAEDLKQMISEIRALDPRPGLSFETPEIETIVPDVYVRQTAKGGFAIELNSDTLPRVLVNSRYYAEVSRGADKKTREFLSEQLQSANWLVRSLQQRATTILKVATEIVRQQDGFFRQGVRHLKPLVLRDIANAIGMHESTVSRVTNNKFMHCPRGIFELKYFFTSSIANAGGGDAHSAESVRDRIKDLVEAEGADILSDDQIVRILHRDGVEIARRTVAKYRESLRIPSSVQRRRDKSAGVAWAGLDSASRVQPTT
jgi:RNA polymerase sigma-54 factor